MSNLIKLKRSAVPGKIPLPTDLSDGELAINTADGKLYLKKSDGSVAEISGSGGVDAGTELAVELFDDGTDFTAGTTTQITLAETPADEDQIQISFNGVVQHHDTYDIVGPDITFTGAIPVGVTTVEVQYLIGASLGLNTVAELLVAGTDFVAGTDDTVTISQQPSNTNGVMVFFDGIYQNQDTYAISGTDITFTSVIPNNVTDVQIIYGVLLGSSTGGNMELVTSVDFTNVATVDFDDIFEEGFIYKIFMSNIQPTIDGSIFGFRLAAVGGTYLTGVGDYEFANQWTINGSASGQAEAATYIPLHIVARTMGANASESLSGEITLVNPNNANFSCTLTYEIVYEDTNNNLGTVVGAGQFRNSTGSFAPEAIDSIRFLMLSGNISSGQITIYRIPL